LRHYCEQGGNKSAAAVAAHTSRTAYYQQLARIEQVLGVRLEDPESMLSLYVALLALDVTRPSEEDSPGRGAQ
jgi:purine catabolism regulator